MGPLFRLLGGGFRQRRFARFRREFPAADVNNILDLGGVSGSWPDAEYRSKVTLVNLDRRERVDGFDFLERDASDTGLPDDTFDLAFSNSVIEHLSTWDTQKRMAAEMHRVGRGIWCQTPSKWFPIEPHYLGLLVHWLPKQWRTYWFIRWFTVRGWMERPSRQKIADMVGEIRLLTRSEFEELFPDCEIWTERWFGLPKSYVAIKPIDRDGRCIGKTVELHS